MSSSVSEDNKAGDPFTPGTVARSIDDFSLERGIPADETFGIESSDFENALGDIGIHWYGYMWTISLGIVGLLDVLATVKPNICHFNRCLDEEHIHESSYLCSECHYFIHWLDKHNVRISFVFSLLWFKLAFNKASWAKERAIVKTDRGLLLSKQEPKNSAAKKRPQLDPRTAYILEFSTNMLFLPVGFYVTIYHLFRRILFERKGLLEAMEEPVQDDIFVAAAAMRYGDPGEATNYEVFTERSTFSLIVAISHHIHLMVLVGTVIARAKFQEFLRRSAIPIMIRKILHEAIRNPRKFRRNLSATLQCFRYLKYLAPIIGALGKLVANVKDMLKKWRQHIIAERQKKVRHLLFRNKLRPVREEVAVIIIQSTWRAHQARRYTDALALLTQNEKAIAAQKIQSVLRRKLAEARHRILAKKRELRRLQRQSMRQSDKMEVEDRRRLYELQDEFTEEANNIINRKLLMRPNTRFAVLWKLSFVLCIGVEIAQKSLTPFVKNRLSMHSRRSKYDTDDMSIRELLADLLIPKRVADLDACKDLRRRSWAQKLHLKKSPLNWAKNGPTTSSWYCYKPYSNWLDTSRDVVSLVLKPFPVSEWSECKVKSKTVLHRLTRKWHKDNASSHPWYCSEPYASLQTYYRWVADFFIDEFMMVVSIICFLDVYVTFFTGEFDPETGELVPKSFFFRWVFPGLLTQLLLNPAIGHVSIVFFSSMQKIFYFGPVRVLRWCIAVVVPVVYMVYKLIMWGLGEADMDESIVNFYNSLRRASVIYA